MNEQECHKLHKIHIKKLNTKFIVLGIQAFHVTIRIKLLKTVAVYEPWLANGQNVKFR